MVHEMESTIKQHFASFVAGALLGWVSLTMLVSCGGEAPPMGEAVVNRDSLPAMITKGVSKLISDSGVIKYKVVAEEWHVFDKTNPPRQYFPKGIYMERYDDKFNVDLTITADTAYCFNQNLWKMRGRVRVVNKAGGTNYASEELYWDMAKHLLYSRCYFRIVTPDKDLEGNWFESDESMSRYHVKRTSGFVPMAATATETDKNIAPQDTTATGSDSLGGTMLRNAPVPTRKMAETQEGA